MGTALKIAIIPARGGSKRIPRKNIKLFCSVPMISYSIEAAINSNLFDKVIVSTDDGEISEVAKLYGAEVPFVRPQNLSDDLTPTVPVIAHAIEKLGELNVVASYVCCIYPCTPFIQTADLVYSFEELIKSRADFIYPVTQYPHPIQRAMRMLPSGKMEFLSSEYELTRTQDLEKTFHDAGQFYWGQAKAWLDRKRMHTEGIGFSIPSWRVVDIDTHEDWERAEMLYKANSLLGNNRD